MQWDLQARAQNVICLDFDDTVCDHDATPLPGAAQAIEQLRDWGYRVLVSSARFSPLYGELNKFRIQKVQNWFDDFEIQVDDIRYHVPAAEVSIDDLGWRFAGDWPSLAAELQAKWPHGLKDKRISVALDCLLTEHGAVTDAEDTMTKLTQAGAKFIVSMGPWLVDQDEDALFREVRRMLEATKLWPQRLETSKVSSDAYVSFQALRFEGDWTATIVEAEERLQIDARKVL